MTEFGPETSLQYQKDLYDREKRGETIEPLSGEELERVQKSIEAMSKLLADDSIIAKYKLEVQFGKNRTSKGFPFAGVLSCWVSGSKLHGGGDEKMYECPNKQCRAWILPSDLGHSVVKDEKGNPSEVPVGYCGGCGSVWPAEQLIGERFLKLTEQHWAQAILQIFVRLEMNADIYLKYSPEDVRYKAMMEMARNRGGEEIAKARRLRGLNIYPLRNIIKDTKHGAPLYGRIRAFINA